MNNQQYAVAAFWPDSQGPISLAKMRTIRRMMRESIWRVVPGAPIKFRHQRRVNSPADIAEGFMGAGWELRGESVGDL